jgi:hypothetical protein
LHSFALFCKRAKRISRKINRLRTLYVFTRGMAQSALSHFGNLPLGRMRAFANLFLPANNTHCGLSAEEVSHV